MLGKILLFIIASGLSTLAQDSLPLARRTIILKWSPPSLFDQESTVQFGVEYFLTNRHSVQQEIGYGPIFPNILGRNYLDNRSVWRFRTEYRIYRRRDHEIVRLAVNGRSVAFTSGTYWAFEWLGKWVAGTTPFYNRDLAVVLPPYIVPVNKQVLAGHVKLGAQGSFRASPQHARRLVWDLSVGAGVRYRFMKANLPDGAWVTYPKGGMVGPLEYGRTIYPSFAGGIKVGYIL